MTGGKSARFGSDKASALLEGRSLMDQLLLSLPQETPIVIVGPEIDHSLRPVRHAREEPIGAGPVSAIQAGLTQVETEYVAVIATDMPFASKLLPVLLENLPVSCDATIPLDSQGIAQTLCAMYRSDSLRNAFTQLGTVNGASVRSLVALLRVRELTLDPRLERNLLDIDTPADLERAITLRQEFKK